MAHLHFIEDTNSDVIDYLVFCSDSCHYTYTEDPNNHVPQGVGVNGANYRGLLETLGYQGWNGCHEINTTQPCLNCGETVQGFDTE
jgi:hypothetical protein